MIVVGVVLFFVGALGSDEEEVKSETASSSSSQVEKENSVDEEQSRAQAESESIAAAESKAQAEAESLAKAEADRVEAERQAAELAAAMTPVTISGTGDIVTEAFEIKSNFMIINSSDNGSSNFIVRLHGVNGSEDGLVNEIGPYSGQQFKEIDPGEYRLEVKSEGNWEITFDPNIPKEGQQSPLSGYGDKVVMLNIEAGNYILNATDNGSSNFIVRVNDSSGLVNEIGPYSGQSIAKFSDSGLYAIQVTSEGDWTLEFTK